MEAPWRRARESTQLHPPHHQPFILACPPSPSHSASDSLADGHRRLLAGLEDRTVTFSPLHHSPTCSMSLSSAVPQVGPCPPPVWQLSPEHIFHPSKHGDERTCGATLLCCVWKDIFDLFCIQQDGWEDAAVTGSIYDEEQQVTAGDLLCHKHPERKEGVGESTSLPLQCQSSSPGITWPTAKKSKENRSLETRCQQKVGETHMHEGCGVSTLFGPRKLQNGSNV